MILDFSGIVLSILVSVNADGLAERLLADY